MDRPAAEAAPPSRSGAPRPCRDAVEPPHPKGGRLPFGRASVGRLCRSIIAAEHARIFRREVDRASLGEETRIDEQGLGFDSLARLELVAAFNRFFGLHRTGIEDYLLVDRRLGGWIDLVSEHLRRSAEGLVITFETSGSTGAPRRVAHPIGDLVEEVAALQGAVGELASEGGRILAQVPPHHIYGFLFTVVHAELSGREVVDLLDLGPGAAARQAAAGDTVVGTPFTWGLAVRSGGRFPAGVNGLTSTAPAPAGLWPDLTALGLDRLVEIYGSTETGGCGWRDASGAPFRLHAHLERTASGGLRRRRSGEGLPLQDRLDWQAPDSFTVAGRLDRKVQVGGHNVSTNDVAAVLAAMPGVAEVAVRPWGERLKAFVVPVTGADPRELEAALRRRAGDLTPAERPVVYDFGAALPRTAMGKLADWEPAQRGADPVALRT